jgi:hypothetical protein
VTPGTFFSISCLIALQSFIFFSQSSQYEFQFKMAVRSTLIFTLLAALRLIAASERVPIPTPVATPRIYNGNIEARAPAPTPAPMPQPSGIFMPGLSCAPGTSLADFQSYISAHRGLSQVCPSDPTGNLFQPDSNNVGCCTESATLTQAGSQMGCCPCGAICTGAAPAMVDWFYAPGKRLRSLKSVFVIRASG